MWLAYFNKAKVFGMDDRHFADINDSRYTLFKGDQADRECLEKFISEFGGDFDLILDDGGHHMKQQQISFGFLFPYVKPEGYYVIEDLHTSKLGGKFIDDKDFPKTLPLVETLKESNQFPSKYLTEEEIEYIQDSIEFVEIFYGSGITAIIKKKA